MHDSTTNDLSIHVDGHFGCFPVGVIMNSVDKDILVHAHTKCISDGCILWNRITGPLCMSMLNLIDIATLFSKVVLPSYNSKVLDKNSHFYIFLLMLGTSSVEIAGCILIVN